MKGKLYLLSALLLLYSPIFAQQVSLETAQRVANIFLQNNVPAVMRSASITNTTTSSASVIKPIGKVAQSPVMYAVSQDSVWVLVSADERVTPILAYSDANAGMFPEEEDMPDGMIALLDWYEQQIQHVIDSTNTTIHEGWQAFLTTSQLQEREIIVSPLLCRNGEENIWQQHGNNGGGVSLNTSYNKYCPKFPKDPSMRTVVGCVALAMGQVMWYWQWPKIAIVQKDKIIREYDWNDMPAKITSETPIHKVDMIAHLLHDAGISVNTIYGLQYFGGSSAAPSNIPIALRNIFGYYCSDKLNRHEYSSSWINILKENLDKGYPILYGGCNSNTDCHRYVIDGYDSCDAFHVNYGYGANKNAYFLLDTIVGKSFEFYKSQNAILNIHPHYPECTSLEVTQNDTLDTTFIIQAGDEITSNKVIESHQTGIICSSVQINLTSGFHTEPGCNLCITIKDMPCQDSESISAIQKRIKETSYKDTWCNQWNVLSHMSLHDATTWIYQLGKDTIINHQTYSTLNVHYSKDENIGFYIGALRFTDDQKVYIHYEDSEYLLYDFNVQVGDVIEVFSGIQNYGQTHTYTHTITDVTPREDGRLLVESEIELKDDNHTLKVKKQWIEGIGSTDGITHNVSSLMESGVHQVLLCAYHDDECMYTTDDPKYMPLGCVYNGEDSSNAVGNTSVSQSSATKIIKEGQLLILRDGKTYNVMGVEVK